ncbi:hypothetical protein V1477_001376 [Vespula maculifrons]|uniref:Uncharacterized protein n=1 Tax=Vespula maculifrons TaxID=7453 RepID=A0ABD2CZD1_VESMC
MVNQSVLCLLNEFCVTNIRHLMCQIVKSAEEADAAHEFITNLPNDTKLLREAPYYLQPSTTILNFNKGAHWIVNAEEWFTKQLEILSKAETSLAIVHRGTAIRGGGRDLLHSKVPTASGFSWSVYAILRRMICRRAYSLHTKHTIGDRLPVESYLFHSKFRYEVSLASRISPQFYDCLFTPSNITASYEAYSRAIADKSLSLSLSGLEKPSDRCDRTSFL